jgi:hypothetical protein
MCMGLLTLAVSCSLLPLKAYAGGVLTSQRFLHNRKAASFMQDEVRPISCRGHDSQGGIAITLIDALDTLLVVPSALFFLPLEP